MKGEGKPSFCNPMPLFFITTLGCKVNQQESDAIAACLESAGWQKTSKIREASILILNTCTVTGKAAAHCRQQIRKMVQHNPTALFMVTGCCAQTEGEALAAMEGVDHVIPHKDKHRIPELLYAYREGQPLAYPSCHDETACEETLFMDIPAPARDMGRTRAFLKIQDGCNAFCTYCIVPYARGRSRSLSPDRVVQKIRDLAEAGYREVVLTGIHVGMYGSDLTARTNFEELLRIILADGEGPRLRMGSLEPREVTDSLIELAASNPRVAPHFHIPMQSGSDAILKAMGRPYDSVFFAERVSAVRKALPLAAIGTDILTGFPGEQENLFAESRLLVETLPLTYLHVFPYSPRPGTPAAGFPDTVPVETARQRSSVLRNIGEDKHRHFARSLRGHTLELIVERSRDRKTDRLKGLTGNYQTLFLDGPDSLLSRQISVLVTDTDVNACLEGTLIP
ncbi:tRNA (N(6)-L-threonylcarbamoyladenosine(37)-C(2))-methylthiotransferase MtaB [Desulfobotulus sp. H1]|uniref:tRNA (N(6)-L-threonylcarbamoyladenosine(37)-C(2))-methylthiotransferase MtaB n=1 Tax=Desulfobotulus pelophilus TaxID=2823377 RepID=A0ABT3N9Z6_9BACT|nr:tRNA (N(6)-L-threonylcarbamoyladenosine(37)-C(2))-methylthiotransferase MtaB [Desulfobotulus pelophilus]MCW7754285.1 tRNA (N(6)-L-threonylcarbamoyladenosine(37)-C(2))-methylthiotransferase MtaB [Desulfobotulus pelophilus]